MTLCTWFVTIKPHDVGNSSTTIKTPSPTARESYTQVQPTALPLEPCKFSSLLHDIHEIHNVDTRQKPSSK